MLGAAFLAGRRRGVRDASPISAPHLLLMNITHDDKMPD